jgi:hypothetical protein
LSCSFIGLRCLAILALDVIVPWTGYNTPWAFVDEGAFRVKVIWTVYLFTVYLITIIPSAQPVRGTMHVLLIERLCIGWDSYFIRAVQPKKKKSLLTTVRSPAPPAFTVIGKIMIKIPALIGELAFGFNAERSLRGFQMVPWHFPCPGASLLGTGAILSLPAANPPCRTADDYNRSYFS